MKKQNRTPLLMPRLCLAGLMLVSAGAYAKVNIGTPNVTVDSVKQILAHLEKHGVNNAQSGSKSNNPFGRVQERQKQQRQESAFINEFEIKSFSNENGVVKISGNLANNRDAHIQLSGDKSKLQGRLTDFANRRVFEYSTNAKGDLQRIEVPAEKYYPDMAKSWIDAVEASKKSLREKNKRDPHSRLQQRFVNNVAVFSALAGAQAPHVAPYNNHNLRTLESRPGSRYVVYLDQSNILDANGVPKPINVSETNVPSYINVTSADVYRVWQVVASQYSMFDLNITTSKAAFDAAATVNKMKMVYLNKGCLSTQAYGSFGKEYSPDHGQACMDSDNKAHWALGVGLTIAHELGHAFSLGHDRTPTIGYFEGNAAVQWTPLMGNYWPAFGWADPLVSFSQGEYTNAILEPKALAYQTTPDDLAMISRSAPRLVQAQVETPLQLVAGQISAASNFGQIKTSADALKYTFNVGSASLLNLSVEPIEVFGSLDIKVRILKSNNQELQSYNPQANRSVKIEDLRLEPGSYKLEISGGAELQPATGFSNYASLGHFAMAGSLKPVPVVPVQSDNLSKTLTMVAGRWEQFTMEVPAGKWLTVVTTAVSGDVDIHVQPKSAPSNSMASIPPVNGCYSVGQTSNERCFIQNSSGATARYYIGLYTFTAPTSSVKFTATISDSKPN